MLAQANIPRPRPREQVLNFVGSKDLTNMAVQISRVGAVDWGTCEEGDTMMTFAKNPAWTKAEEEINFKAHQKNFLDRPCTFMARIHLVYDIEK